MDVFLNWPDTPVAYSTAPIREDTVFTFTCPDAGQTTLSVGYGPQGSHMMRSWHLSGPGVDYSYQGQQIVITGHVGPPVLVGGVMITKFGYEKNGTYKLTMSNPKPQDGRSTEVYYQMKPSSGG